MDEIIDEVISILKAVISKDKIRHYFHGDPGEIASSYLPCCIVDSVSTPYTSRYTGFDQVKYRVKIILVDDARKYFMKAPEQVTGKKFLEQVMEGTTNGALNTNSILYLLRTKFTLNGKVIEGSRDATVEYGFRPRGEIFGLESQVVVEYLSRLQINRS